MICCCSDGTRPVIFKIDRLDYQRVSIKGMGCENCEKKIRAAFEALPGVKEVPLLMKQAWLKYSSKQAFLKRQRACTKKPSPASKATKSQESKNNYI